HILFRVDLPLAQYHPRDHIRSRTQAADGDAFALEIFRFDDVFAHDEVVFQAIDADSDEFRIENAGNRQAHYRRHVGVRGGDAAADHRLAHQRAAVEID